MRLREHSFGGTVINVDGLAQGATVLSSAELVKLPALTSGDDYYTAVLDPNGEGSGPEIIYITEHTSGATPNEWATILRGKEETTDVAHAVGTKIVFSPWTTEDFHSKRIHFAIDLVKHTDATPDDRFDYTDGSLDSKWTNITGSPTNTQPDLVAEGVDASHYWVNDGLEIYQQGSPAEMGFGQDYTLPDGKSIIAKFTTTAHTNDISGTDTNIGISGLFVNDSNTGARAANSVGIISDHSGDLSRWHTQGDTGGGLAQVATADTQPPDGMIYYFRIARDGLNYYPFISQTGRIWYPATRTTLSSAADNIWIWFYSGTSGGDRGTLTRCHWVREGDNTRMPW